MRRKWGRSYPESATSLLLSVVLLAVIWAGAIVFIGGAFRLAVYLFCIGYRC